MHISSARGAPMGYHAPSLLQPDDSDAMRRWEPSPARNRYVENHNARLTQGAKHPGPNPVGKD
jgi:hypothetical protein